MRLLYKYDTEFGCNATKQSILEMNSLYRTSFMYEFQVISELMILCFKQ